MKAQNMPDNENPVSKEFPELFHYTNVFAFTNICKEQILRATHYEDVNDKSELGRFRIKVGEFIRPIILKHCATEMISNKQIAKKVTAAGGIHVVVDRETTKLLDIAHNVSFGKNAFEPFLCSFCTHGTGSYEAKNGLLSQWRGYAAQGGVAIVLDTRRIESMMRHEQEIFAHPINHIGDVIYDNYDERIKKDFSTVFEFFPEILDILYKMQKPPFEKIYRDFIIGSTLVKHHGFYEEKEVRIVVAPRPNRSSMYYEPKDKSKPSKVIHDTKRGDRKIRYRFIELFGDTPLPIKRVIIGPSQFRDTNFQQVADHVRGRKIDVVKSETPFSG